MRITKSFVDSSALPPFTSDGKAAQVFYRDSAIPGFGLRITSGGAKSFIVEKRIDGRVKRITLGRYGNLTVEQAKKQAMELLGKVASGRNPIAEKKEKQAKGITLIQAFEDYLLARKDLKPTTIKDYRYSLNGPFKDWQNKRLTDITKDMIELRHRELGERSHARANNSMRVLRAIYNYAQYRYEDAKGNPIIATNPVERLSQTRAWFKVQRRRRLILPHQLSAWHEATHLLINQTTGDYLRFLLFTGLRRSEASRLTWGCIDFEGRTLTISETKNGLEHVLPLSDYLEELLKRRCEESTSTFVFPSESKMGYLLDPKNAVIRVSELSGIPFTLHDLRRTFITIAESLDIPAYALKKLLNHKDPNDVTEGYIVSNVERLRVPMEKISHFILESINGNDIS